MQWKEDTIAGSRMSGSFGPRHTNNDNSSVGLSLFYSKAVSHLHKT